MSESVPPAALMDQSVPSPLLLNTSARPCLESWAERVVKAKSVAASS
jgi:hypothetical protein